MAPGEASRPTSEGAHEASTAAGTSETNAAMAAPAPGKTAPPSTQADGAPAKSAATPAATRQAPPTPRQAPAASVAAQARDVDGSVRHKSSPLVRRIAKEHGVDIAGITGSGSGGRVTKHDILDYLERAPAADAPIAAKAPSVPTAPGPSEASGTPDRIDVEPMSIMRKKIAEHMILSRRTSAHVYSVFEVNYTAVDSIRKARKDEYDAQGAKLTFTSFIAKVVVDCLRLHPVVNASIDGENIVYKHDVNLGIAVALENGLIVPVVKHAGEKNVLGLTRAIADVAERARTKKLSPDEVHGGTFTITNPGNFGAQFGLPIINQPQVAILGVGTIEKRPVVIDDMIGIRLLGYLTLGYDHRLIDGAVADQFMADVKKGIETFDERQL
ncbi:MAG: 2-oxo acid dehydrogenase subunit E2 [Acidobacteria bacterium]|nr:2-oxo acid dehydrogenase subunit E2 [Acidobacteriota bacterium]